MFWGWFVCGVCMRVPTNLRIMKHPFHGKDHKDHMRAQLQAVILNIFIVGGWLPQRRHWTPTRRCEKKHIVWLRNSSMRHPVWMPFQLSARLMDQSALNFATSRLRPALALFSDTASNFWNVYSKKRNRSLLKLASHNPVWRWSNSIYGYCNSKDKWAEMIIMYYSREPYSAAMLEAALIEKYNGN